MTIRHIELRGSRSGTDATDRGSTAELVWSVDGSNDLDAVQSYLTPFIPSEYRDLTLKSISWEHQGYAVWEFRASYVHPDKADAGAVLEVGDYTFSFDTSGGTVLRTVSKATTKYAKGGETAADFKGSIGVTTDTIEGVEIGIPALKFSIRKRVANATLTLAYVNLLHNMTYTTNNATFLGFAAGELLFVGASGQQGTDSDPEITFNFIASPNATGLTVGEITGVAKQGHEYLWVYFEETADDVAKKTVKRPLSAYVEQVYDASNFGNLGIV
ncbi:MAG: hypothetical protein ACYC4U_11425 [Pirellulaceae bacterium]